MNFLILKIWKILKYFTGDFMKQKPFILLKCLGLIRLQSVLKTNIFFVLVLFID